MNATPPRALIVGGSLAGLLAASTLRQIGWQVDVFERSTHDLDGRGAGLGLQPEVIAAFNFSKIKHATLGVRSNERLALDRDGNVDRQSFVVRTQTSWHMLYGALRAALPNASMHTGETFRSFQPQGNKVEALFESGRVEVGDLLIGADGARSAVRSQVLPGLVPTYAGYVAWRGVLPEKSLPASTSKLLADAFAVQQDPSFMFLEYLIPGEDGSVKKGGAPKELGLVCQSPGVGLARAVYRSPRHGSPLLTAARKR